MNLGQLATLLRDRFLVDVQRLTTVRGMPFGAEQLEHEFRSHLAVLDTIPEPTPPEDVR
jgi:2-oxoglutarate ferredoxin oxidoreductase subunit alpha